MNLVGGPTCCIGVFNFKKARELVAAITNHSTNIQREFAYLQKENELTGWHHPENPCVTKWNSYLIMLEFLQENPRNFRGTCWRASLDMFDEEEWDCYKSHWIWISQFTLCFLPFTWWSQNLFQSPKIAQCKFLLMKWYHCWNGILLISNDINERIEGRRELILASFLDPRTKNFNCTFTLRGSS